eukprot:scaffold25871_cov79-Isochrysis_galbana.AAC.1
MYRSDGSGGPPATSSYATGQQRRVPSDASSAAPLPEEGSAPPPSAEASLCHPTLRCRRRDGSCGGGPAEPALNERAPSSAPAAGSWTAVRTRAAPAISGSAAPAACASPAPPCAPPAAALAASSCRCQKHVTAPRVTRSRRVAKPHLVRNPPFGAERRRPRAVIERPAAGRQRAQGAAAGSASGGGARTRAPRPEPGGCRLLRRPAGPRRSRVGRAIVAVCGLPLGRCLHVGQASAGGHGGGGADLGRGVAQALAEDGQHEARKRGGQQR